MLSNYLKQGQKKLQSSQFFILKAVDHLPQKLRHQLANQLGFGYLNLDPSLRLMLALKKKQRRAGFLSQDLAKDRIEFENNMQLLNRKKTTLTQVKDYQCQNHQFRYYSDQPNTSLPLLIYLHGGGFVTGSVDSHDEVCRILAKTMQVQVVSIEYPLAPEHSPSQILSYCQLLIQYLLTDTPFKILNNQVAIAGDSAGGNLATLLAQHFHRIIQAQLLIYPALDFTTSYESYKKYADDLVLTRADIDLVRHYYAEQHQLALDDPLISPSYAQLNGQPACFIVTAGHDVLHDEALAYVEKLQAHKVQVQYLNYPAQTHGFVQLTSVIRSAKQSLVELSEQFKLFWQAQVPRETFKIE